MKHTIKIILMFSTIILFSNCENETERLKKEILSYQKFLSTAGVIEIDFKTANVMYKQNIAYDNLINIYNLNPNSSSKVSLNNICFPVKIEKLKKHFLSKLILNDTMYFEFGVQNKNNINKVTYNNINLYLHNKTRKHSSIIWRDFKSNSKIFLAESYNDISKDLNLSTEFNLFEPKSNYRGITFIYDSSTIKLFNKFLPKSDVYFHIVADKQDNQTYNSLIISNQASLKVEPAIQTAAFYGNRGQNCCP